MHISSTDYVKDTYNVHVAILLLPIANTQDTASEKPKVLDLIALRLIDFTKLIHSIQPVGW